MKAVGLDPAMYGTHHETHEGITDLSQDEEPAGGSTALPELRKNLCCSVMEFHFFRTGDSFFDGSSVRNSLSRQESPDEQAVFQTTD